LAVTLIWQGRKLGSGNALEMSEGCSGVNVRRYPGDCGSPCSVILRHRLQVYTPQGKNTNRVFSVDQSSGVTSCCSHALCITKCARIYHFRAQELKNLGKVGNEVSDPIPFNTPNVKMTLRTPTSAGYIRPCCYRLCHHG